MNIQRENISPTRVKLTVSLDKSALADAEAVALTKLAKSVKAPGFRKGKVPVTVAKKHIEPAHLAQETLENAVSKAVAEAFADQNLQALERPEVEVTKYEHDAELEFTAEGDVMPEVSLGDYKKLKLDVQPARKILKKDVEDTLLRIKQQLATKESVDRAAKNGDEVVIDFVGKKDGKPFDGGAGQQYPLTLGSKSFIRCFEDALVGVKAGQETDVKLSFPDDYHVADLAGAPVVFEVKVHEVKQVVLPEDSDELAAKTGPFTSMDELRADIKRELKNQADQEHQDALRDAAVAALVKASKAPVPAVLKQDQLQAIERDMTQNLMYQGVTLEQWLEQKGYANRQEWIDKEAAELAESRVQAGLVLAELSKAEQITATNEELAERLQAMKDQYAKQPDMAKRFDEPEVQRDMANRLLTEKTVDRLVELNTKK